MADTITSSDPRSEPDRALIASEASSGQQALEISHLAAGLAHEIRNPLSTMMLNLDLLAEDFAHPESNRDQRVRQKLERVRRETHRLQDIVEAFLRYASVHELKRRMSDLNSVVDDLRDFCEPEAAAHSVVIRTNYAEDLPRLPLDVDLFKQAVLNLILNAIKAMPEGGDLILQTQREGPWHVLEVTDTGVGIEPSLQTRVFDAFYSTRKGGTGLGLPTARRIVEAHGGSIRLWSEPGRGSKFTLRLPSNADLIVARHQT